MIRVLCVLMLVGGCARSQSGDVRPKAMEAGVIHDAATSASEGASTTPKDGGPNDSRLPLEPCPSGPERPERPDCTGYCPEAFPGDGTPCAAVAQCAYSMLRDCACRLPESRWSCFEPECVWDTTEHEWLGPDCDECPTVENPMPGVSYGPCTSASPSCWLSSTASYYCEDDGSYTFARIAVP
ncbi:MAG: hypothetical protein OXU20_35955 [Myxococcales bacterium]|nr:hypothetical protein [Myxococcales bacterium]